jgi:hypothetical protein
METLPLETRRALAGYARMVREHDIDDRNLGGPERPEAQGPAVEPGVCPECRGAGVTLTGDVCPLCEGTGRANARVGGG